MHVAIFYVFSQVMEERDCTTNTTNSSTVNTNMLHPHHTMCGVQPLTSEDKPSYVVYEVGTSVFISLTITLQAQLLIWKFPEIWHTYSYALLIQSSKIYVIFFRIFTTV